MEALYTKLYDKYNALKKKKLSELDEINEDQEVKFLNYVSAAEELIQHLRDENDRLCTKLNDLRSEVASVRCNNDERCTEYQNLLTEENQKNKKLFEEVERLQKLLQDGHSYNLKNSRSENLQLNVHESSQDITGAESQGSVRRRTRKRSRVEAWTGAGSVSSPGNHQYDTLIVESAKISSKEACLHEELCKDQQSESCMGIVDLSGVGGAKNDTCSSNCPFQALIEYLIGMKLSAVNQTEGICISALHQSSDYAFSLTWVKKAAGEEPELVYRVSTLGTFERIAPEWMRSDLMFSMSMCPIFFERIARVIKLHR
ncbi:hypothetical protein K2173_015785 [Erythroxylum novogranatense]|uniref:DUF7806 domain-containing protein n=1 Tax=Erythroxylum novogranatense TaxID=1862640 RepID=A0AAV8SED8_9ROSI|nr:hypothetical protein K2173_015785 [Erythroxylum novogranatense]